MSKLKCEKHERRVFVLDGDAVRHREDGSKCTSRRLVLRRILFSVGELDKIATRHNEAEWLRKLV